jgi:ABC-type lipoprotein release transport system permease subunit
MNLLRRLFLRLRAIVARRFLERDMQSEIQEHIDRATERFVARGIVIAPGVNVYLIGATIAVVLLTVAAAATWMPARRAARVDPAMTLRVDV